MTPKKCVTLLSNCCMVILLLTGSQCVNKDTSEYSNDYGPCVSSDGEKIAFSSNRDGYSSIYIMNIDGSGQKLLVTDTIPLYASDWSPNDSLIAYTAEIGGNYDIFIIKTSGSIPVRLTDNDFVDVRPQFSPEGLSIAFTSSETESWDIYTMNIDGSNRKKITNNPSADLISSWSPDGSKILFSSKRDGRPEIYQMNSDGSLQSRLTNNDFDDKLAKWSPDGKKILFESNSDGNWDLFVMNRDGTQRDNLTSSSANENNASWIEDGSAIVYDTDLNFIRDIFTMDLGTRKQINLTKRSNLPGRWLKDVRYGPFERNVMDLWLLNSLKPSPLVIYFHGGGFRGGDKRSIEKETLTKLLENGISVAAVNYRYTTSAKHPAQLMDCSRALQFIRYHCEVYNIDPDKIGATGGSAGADIAMWLAFRDDMADENNDDPVLRMSTRLQAVVPLNGQTFFDPFKRIEVFNSDQFHPGFYLLFGIDNEDDYVNPKYYSLYEDASAITHLTPDDPPIYMYYRQANTELPPNSPYNWIAHHPKYGIILKEKADSLGVECHMKFRSDFPDGHPIDEYVKFFCEKFGL